MSIYKRNDTYWYKFQFNGASVRESTKQGNDKVARQMEAAHRTSLAKGEVGLRDKKPVLTLGESIRTRFEPWAKASFETASPATWNRWYRPSLKVISAHTPLAKLKLDEVTSEHVSGFAAYLQSERPAIKVGGKVRAGMVANSVNSRLRVLRRLFKLAVEWGAVATGPKIKMVAGAAHRDRVLASDEEARYLAAADPLLLDVATVLIDTGQRPEELFRQRWENVTWVNGRHGNLIITHGKTAAARRQIPMTARVRAVLENRWLKANKPEEGWMFPAPTQSGHVEPSSVKKQHRAALVASKVRPFVLYSLRHTFLTRLGASGCDVWTLARIAGHSNINISKTYVHPGEDTVLDAMNRLSGHKNGHSAETEVPALSGGVA